MLVFLKNKVEVYKNRLKLISCKELFGRKDQLIIIIAEDNIQLKVKKINN